MIPLLRYDRFQDAFEHVSTIIDDIYKVRVLMHVHVHEHMIGWLSSHVLFAITEVIK